MSARCLLILVLIHSLPGAEFAYGQASAGTTPAAPMESSANPQGKDKKQFEYKPSCKEAWVRLELLIAKEHWNQVLNTTALDCGDENIARDELHLLQSQAFAKAGHPLIGQRLLNLVIKRSLNLPAGQMALHQLNKLAFEYSLDDQELEDLALTLNAPVESESARSMIDYFKWRAYNRRSLKSWAEAALARVGDTSPWHFDWLYRQAAEMVAQGDLNGAKDTYAELARNDNTRRPTRELARLQLSRLLFEQKDYSASVAEVQLLNLPVREKGRSLLQMAWAQFYQNDYGKALGLLEALKSPYFTSSKTPERNILQMLIFRDLCQYRYLRSAIAQFYREYGPIYRAIEGRTQLTKNRTLMAMALLEDPLQTKANVVHELRHAGTKLGEMLRNRNQQFRGELAEYLAKREQSLRYELDRTIGGRMKSLADYMVDIRDQIKSISYTSEIQSLSTERDLTKDYKPDEIKAFEFDKLYWKIQKEFWWDEMPFYQAQIASRCGQSETFQGESPSSQPKKKSRR